MDLIEIPAGSFIKDADRVAIVEVLPDAADKQPGLRKRARVVEALRGVQVGAEIPLQQWLMPVAYPAGQQLLIACSKAEGFCIHGLPGRGYYEFVEHLVGHGPVQIPPGILEPPALRAFAAGKPAPDFCAYAHIKLVDEPDAAEDWPLRLHAADGKGTARRDNRSGPEYSVSLFVQQGKSALSLQTPGGQWLSLIGAAPHLAKDGCYTIDVAPTYPLARTKRRLERLLHGADDEQVLARGVVQVNAGAALPAGKYPITVEWTQNRGTVFRCSLLRDAMAYYTGSPLNAKMLSFPMKDAKDREFLGIEIGSGRDPDSGLNLAQAVPPKTTKTFPLRLHKYETAGTVIGTVTLTHVEDDVKARPKRAP